MPRERRWREAAVLYDIHIAAERTRVFVGGMDYLAFRADAKTQSAVIHQLLVIGEATKRLSLELRTENPGIPWIQMAGMRDKLIHGYDVVDLEEVWRVVTQDLPALLDAVAKILPPADFM